MAWNNIINRIELGTRSTRYSVPSVSLWSLGCFQATIVPTVLALQVLGIRGQQPLQCQAWLHFDLENFPVPKGLSLNDIFWRQFTLTVWSFLFTRLRSVLDGLIWSPGWGQGEDIKDAEYWLPTNLYSQFYATKMCKKSTLKAELFGISPCSLVLWMMFYYLKNTAQVLWLEVIPWNMQTVGTKHY